MTFNDRLTFNWRKLTSALILLAALGSQSGCGYKEVLLCGGHFIWEHQCGCCNCDYCGCGCEHSPRCCVCPSDMSSPVIFDDAEFNEPWPTLEFDDLPEPMTDSAGDIETDGDGDDDSEGPTDALDDELDEELDEALREALEEALDEGDDSNGPTLELEDASRGAN